MATAAGESPTTTNGFCSPAFDTTGIEQKVAIALTATRLRMTGGIDIMLPHRNSGQSFPAYGYLNWRVLEGGSSLLLRNTTSTCSGFHLKNVRDKMVGRGSRIAPDSSRRGASYLRHREASSICVPSRGYDARTTARRAYRPSGSARPASIAALVTSQVVREPRPTSD
jgi:hypothetical protein